jgi:mycothiol system anti-sigma-R factor
MWQRRAVWWVACQGGRGVSEHVDKKEDSAPGATGLFGVQVDCEEAVHELYTYLDGELTEERRKEIRIHLDYCGPCGGAAEFEAELRRVIANRCKDRVPDSLIRRVADAIEAESQQHDGGH